MTPAKRLFDILVALLGVAALLLPVPDPLFAGPLADPLAAAQEAVDGGDSERALDLLAPILKREPKNARALLLRSTARCIGGELDLCRKDLDQALALDPALRQGWLNRAGLAISEKRSSARRASPPSRSPARRPPRRVALPDLPGVLLVPGRAPAPAALGQPRSPQPACVPAGRRAGRRAVVPRRR